MSDRVITNSWSVDPGPGRTIYEVVEEGGHRTFQMIGVMDTPEFASEAVSAHNERLARWRASTGPDTSTYIGQMAARTTEIGRTRTTAEGGRPARMFTTLASRKRDAHPDGTVVLEIFYEHQASKLRAYGMYSVLGREVVSRFENRAGVLHFLRNMVSDHHDETLVAWADKVFDEIESTEPQDRVAFPSPEITARIPAGPAMVFAQVRFDGRAVTTFADPEIFPATSPEA